MNLKKVQCRWHRFSPATFPQGRLLSSPTLGYQKYKPYRLDSPTHPFTQRGLTAFARRHSNETRRPCTIHSPNDTNHSTHNLPKQNNHLHVIHPNEINRPIHNPSKRNRRGGARPNARAAAFPYQKYTHCARGMNDECALAGRHGRAHRHRPYPSPSNHTWCALTASRLYFR